MLRLTSAIGPPQCPSTSTAVMSSAVGLLVALLVEPLCRDFTQCVREFCRV